MLATLVRPTGYADWASGPSGAARIVEPTQTEKNLGWQAGVSGGAGFNAGVPPSTYFNWGMNLYYQWDRFNNEARWRKVVGGGEDGDAIIVATRYIASRDMRFRDLAIGPSGVFCPNGWPWMAQVLTGVSGTIEGIAGNGGEGHTGVNVLPRYGGIPASGPLRGAFGQDLQSYSFSGGVEPNPSGILHVQGAVGGAFGGTGGRLGSDTVSAVFMPGPGGTLIGPTGVWQRDPEWLNAVQTIHTINGPTQSYVRGAPGGGVGAMTNTAGGGGGAGGEHIRGNVGVCNFRGTIRSRGGDGGTGYYTQGSIPAGGGGGGGAGGAAELGVGDLLRLDVNYDVRGGRGGPPGNWGSSGGGTGGNGATGPALQVFQL